MDIDDALDLIDKRMSGFAAGTIADREAFDLVCRLARLGAAVESMPVTWSLRHFSDDGIMIDWDVLLCVTRREDVLGEAATPFEALQEALGNT